MSELPFPLRGVEGVVDDGTLLRAAEEREELLETAVAYLRILLESTHEGIVGLDPEGRCLFVNAAAERMLGAQRAELIGRPFREHDAGDAVDGEQTLRRADGTVFLAAVTTNPIVHEGAVQGFVVAFTDVGPRRRAEQYLGTQRAVAAVLADSADADEAVRRVLAALGETIDWCEFGAFWTGGEVGLLRCTTTWTSPVAEEVYSTFAELSGTLALRPGRGLPGRAYALGHATWLPVAEALANQGSYERAPVLAGIGLRGGVAFPIVAGGDVLGVIELFGRQLAVPDEELMETMSALGAPLGHFLERKRAESEADRLKDEFISLVSHELRTPLSSVLGYLELLEREEAGPLTDEQRECAAAIGRNANRLLRLVGDLLLAARLEAGDLQLAPAAVRLAETGAVVIEELRPLASERGVELVLEAEDDPVVKGDPQRLAQVVRNLVSNALKFTAAGGRASVRVAHRASSALLEVSDTGTGIAHDEVDRLFQPFFRTASARAEAVQGTGLGLAITKALVVAHGGSISCTSSEGNGTRFLVELPLAAPAGGPVATGRRETVDDG